MAELLQVVAEETEPRVVGFPAAGLDLDRPLRRKERQPPRGGSEVGRWGPQEEAHQVAPVAVRGDLAPARHRVQDVGEERQVAAGDPAPEARRGEADLIQECQTRPAPVQPASWAAKSGTRPRWASVPKMTRAPSSPLPYCRGQ